MRLEMRVRRHRKNERTENVVVKIVGVSKKKNRSEC